MREKHMVCKLLLHHWDYFLINFEFTIDGIFGGETLASCLAG